MNKGLKIFIILVVIAIIIVAAIAIYIVVSDKQNQMKIESISLGKDQGTEKIEVFSGRDRSVAVMIDNHKSAWMQARNKFCLCCL